MCVRIWAQASFVVIDRRRPSTVLISLDSVERDIFGGWYKFPPAPETCRLDILFLVVPTLVAMSSGDEFKFD